MNFLLLALFIIHVSRETLYGVYIWQLKEYRFDRMISHLATAQGKGWILSPFSLIGWLILTFYFFGFSSPILLVIFYAGELIWKLQHVIKKPVFTAKATVIVFITVCVSLVFIFFLAFTPLNILFVDKFRPLIIASFVLVLNGTTFVNRMTIKNKAKEKLQNFDHLIRIGITGSYGKTSTKEFLATIVNEKFSVCKTSDMVNTNIGIAQTITKTLTKNHEVFIAEIGAYKKGEVAEITSFVQPSIGVITGINEQHLELFGSLENTKKAKYELVESLPKNGIAIFNGDDKNVFDLIKKAKKQKRLTVLTYGFQKSWDVYADNIDVKPESVFFALHLKEKKLSVHVNLLGKQHIPNILAAVSVALKLGLTVDQIKQGISQLTFHKQTMAKAGDFNGATLVDDTFNANPKSVQAAVDYMSIFSGKKYLVLTPMIELGREARRLHKNVGRYVSKICDQIILTNKNFFDSFVSEVPKSERKKIAVLDPSSATTFFKQNLSTGDVVVFEGKEAAKTLKELQRKIK